MRAQAGPNGFARPLVRRERHLDTVHDTALEATIRGVIAESPADAVLTLRVVGALSDAARRVLSAREPPPPHTSDYEP